MSASGKKTMIINPRERALSTDINRLQAFAGRDLADALSYLYDYVGDAFSSGGMGSVGSTTGSPLRGMIFGGLTVRPQMASANTLVDPGVAVVVNPDGVPNPDDSPYKIVNDPGVTNGASLAMPANSSGGTQIYVVECQRVDQVLETDNRDTYNPSSGLFSPALVNKVIASRFSYRIRVGALASGVTTSSGWLPLMVAIVPNGATTWNNVTYAWDVRPLVSDLTARSGRFTQDRSPVRHLYRMTGAAGTPGLKGWAQAEGPGGRTLGGVLAKDVTALLLDFTSSELQPSGFALTASRPYYLWLAEPFGLPRWCRYTTVAFGSREPGPLRGIPVLSNNTNAPNNQGGNQNVVSLPLPAAFGFPSPSGSGTAACIFMGLVSSGGAMVEKGYSDGRTFWQNYDGVQGVPSIGATTLTSAAATYNLVAGTHYPSNAKAIYVLFTIAYAANAPAAALVNPSVSHDDGDVASTMVSSVWQSIVTTLTTAPYAVSAVVKVPIASPYPAGSGSATKLTIQHAASSAGYATNPTSSAIQVVGWDL